MIVVHTTVPLAPDSREEARDVVTDLVERSRRESGVVRYRAMVDLDDEHTLRFFEQYEDEAAWRAHTETDHYERFVDRLPDLVDETMETINLVDVGAHEVHEFTAADLSADGE